MNAITFEDALLEETISFMGDSTSIEQHEDEEIKVTESLFFPGCSFLNSSIELIEEVYQTLRSDHQADGITLLCCEKPLDYKSGMQEIKEAFSKRFRESLISHGVKRIITACPNCFYELGKVCSQDAQTKEIEICGLPHVLFDCGHIVPASVSESLFPIAVHDACSDRGSGYYADSVRRLFSAEHLTELEHSRGRSTCCGSIPRAAGKQDLAAKDARTIFTEAKQAEANALVTTCMSCSRLLVKSKAGAKSDTSVYHYLELVYGRRVDWKATPEHLILRFRYQGLFDLD